MIDVQHASCKIIALLVDYVIPIIFNRNVYIICTCIGMSIIIEIDCQYIPRNYRAPPHYNHVSYIMNGGDV